MITPHILPKDCNKKDIRKASTESLQHSLCSEIEYSEEILNAITDELILRGT